MFEWFEKFFERVPLEGASEIDGDGAELVELHEKSIDDIRRERRSKAIAEQDAAVSMPNLGKSETDTLAEAALVESEREVLYDKGPLPKPVRHPDDVPDVGPSMDELEGPEESVEFTQEDEKKVA